MSRTLLLLVILPVVLVSGYARTPPAPVHLDEDGTPIHKPAVPNHHVALTEAQRDIEKLKAELAQARAQAEMCQAGIKVPAPPSK